MRKSRVPGVRLAVPLSARIAPPASIVAGVGFAVTASGRAVDHLTDVLAGTGLWWLMAAVTLHVCGQLARGLAWRGVLVASWPGVSRTRACGWYVCGAGLTGVLSARGGDAVRMALAKRELRTATWPALAG